MGRIYDAMREWFEEAEWKVEEHPEKGIIAAGVDGENAKWRCYARANEESELFVFYAVAQVNVPEDKRLAVAEVADPVQQPALLLEGAGAAAVVAVARPPAGQREPAGGLAAPAGL